jgi:hypothetical protein
MDVVPSLRKGPFPPQYFLAALLAQKISEAYHHRAERYLNKILLVSDASGSTNSSRRTGFRTGQNSHAYPQVRSPLDKCI